jgi:hypothetical protein
MTKRLESLTVHLMIFSKLVREKATSGPLWTVPELLFEKKHLIPALPQMLLSQPHGGSILSIAVSVNQRNAAV